MAACVFSIETGARLEGHGRHKWVVAGAEAKRFPREVFGVLLLPAGLVSVSHGPCTFPE